MAYQGRQNVGESVTSRIKTYGDIIMDKGANAHLGDIIQDITIAGGHHVHYHCKQLYSLSGTEHLVRSIPLNED